MFILNKEKLLRKTHTYLMFNMLMGYDNGMMMKMIINYM